MIMLIIPINHYVQEGLSLSRLFVLVRCCTILFLPVLPIVELFKEKTAAKECPRGHISHSLHPEKKQEKVEEIAWIINLMCGQAVL